MGVGETVPAAYCHGFVYWAMLEVHMESFSHASPTRVVARRHSYSYAQPVASLSDFE